jgi:hypothetical protein
LNKSKFRLLFRNAFAERVPPQTTRTFSMIKKHVMRFQLFAVTLRQSSERTRKKFVKRKLETVGSEQCGVLLCGCAVCV